MTKEAAHRPTPDYMKPGARYTMSIEPTRTVRTAAFDWDYDVEVALPPSYRVAPDKHYPVLWVTDGNWMFQLAVGLLNILVMGGHAPEMIVVGVGCPAAAGAAEWSRRRRIDFYPPGKTPYWDGPGSDYVSSLAGMDGPRQADAFLAFLVDELRPALAAAYRMDADHGLMGHSGGGMFASYALFARPGAFRRYIIGSPSSNASEKAAFRLEAAYSAVNTDYKADVFFGVGEREISQVLPAAMGLASSAILMAETLRVRRYPSLKVTTRVFPGKDHINVTADVMGEGISAVWADRVDAAMRPYG
jgi:predicted alpha/beta superfamily hydrolase